MKIGFIGAGTMATTVGRHLINAGHEIVLSHSRGPGPLAEIVAELGPAAYAGTKQQAVDCDVVILATKGGRRPGPMST
jgi:8-hydroxy-5-deazaflavin:NADPH oxidoreductase